MTFPLVLDILLAVLLAATIAYAVVLNRKLGNLRRHKEELERLASVFAESTMRAEESIGKLKGAAGELQGRIDKAEGLGEDLTFLIERGGSAADRLEEAVRGARKTDNKSSTPPSPPEPVPLGTSPKSPVETVDDAPRQSRESGSPETVDPAVRSQAEKELLEALRSVR